MQTKWTQPQAYELLKQYNQDAFHLRHGRTVEEVMRCFARELGYCLLYTSPSPRDCS